MLMDAINTVHFDLTVLLDSLDYSFVFIITKAISVMQFMCNMYDPEHNLFPRPCHGRTSGHPTLTLVRGKIALDALIDLSLRGDDAMIHPIMAR
jgi:hypothetical protein